MSHYLTDYETMLHQRGFRVTHQRRMILDAVCEGDGHTTFDAIYARVQARCPTVSQATVYRALHFFVKMHLVVSADINGEQVYEIATSRHHHHLICRGCGWVGNLDDAHLRDLSAHLLREHGFRADVDHLVITGLCPECQATTE